MKTIEQLKLGYSDAQNYSKRKDKVFFNEIFVRNSFLDKLLNENVYFLIGEKGTGKTAYATFLSNNNYKDTRGVLSYINATDYEKFYTLKKNNHLELSDFNSIWKVIILLLFSQFITQNESTVAAFNKSKLKQLNQAIESYYMNAFTPEITTILKIMDESEIVAKILSTVSEVGGTKSKNIEFSETRFQHNLYFIEKKFSEALSTISLKKDIVLFIDGIDIRPDSIPYNDYIECIKGLSNAMWYLNTSLFAIVKGSQNILRVVLLLRPDIYNSLSLQNATNKLVDNSVYLDWTTTYDDYESSNLYQIAKKILSYDQTSNSNIDDYFKYYFKWKSDDGRTAFMDFLRISLSRPRDILIIMIYIKEQMLQKGMGKSKEFSMECFESNNFQNNYSDYFMSSLKDQLSFYYSGDEFKILIKFFDFFENADFTYQMFEQNYDKFVDYILDNANDIPAFVEDKKQLLQLLYDNNMIVAIEHTNNGNYYFHFSYREREIYNITPEIPDGNNITYRFHYGIYKKAKFGRY